MRDLALELIDSPTFDLATKHDGEEPETERNPRKTSKGAAGKNASDASFAIRKGGNEGARARARTSL